MTLADNPAALDAVGTWLADPHRPSGAVHDAARDLLAKLDAALTAGQDWRPVAGLAGLHVWLKLLAEKAAGHEGWSGEDDLADPHLPCRLTFTDAEATIRVEIRPTAVYEPTL